MKQRQVKIAVCIDLACASKQPLAIDGLVNPPAYFSDIAQDIYRCPDAATRAAVELALDLKGRYSDVEVTVFAADSSAADEILRFYLACGADRAVRRDVGSHDWRDTFCTASLLAELIAPGDFDLILCGNQTAHERFSVLAPFLSELLSLPLLRDILSLDVADGAFRRGSVVKIECQGRRPGGHRQSLACELPAVLSVDPLYSDMPPYISLHRQRRASAHAIEVLSEVQKSSGASQASAFNRTGLKRLQVPTPRVKRVHPRPAEDYAEKMKQMMFGGLSDDGPNKAIEGDAGYVADKIVDFMEENRLL